LVGEVKRDRGVGEAFEESSEPQQLRPQLPERTAGFGLVPQRAAEPEEGHGRGVRVDLDRPTAGPGRRVDVEPEPGRQPRSPRGLAELLLAGVGRMSARTEARKVTVQLGLGGPVPGRVGHHERCVDRHEAATRDVGPESSLDGVVRHRGREMDEAPPAVEGGEPGGVLLPPGEVHPDVVHEDTLPYRSLLVRRVDPAGTRVRSAAA
jgi:hypothetical protein